MRRFDLLAGLIASVVANTGFRGPEKPVVPADFFPDRGERIVQREETSPQDRLEMLRSAFKGLAVRVQKNADEHANDGL